MDNNMIAEQAQDLSEVVIVKEAGMDAPYKIEDASIEFDVAISDAGDLIFKGGRLITSYFIQNTELDSLETWRYFIKDVKIKNMHVSTKLDMITYDFEADSFVDYTVGTEEDNG